MKICVTCHQKKDCAETDSGPMCRACCKQNSLGAYWSPTAAEQKHMDEMAVCHGDIEVSSLETPWGHRGLERGK